MFRRIAFLSLFLVFIISFLPISQEFSVCLVTTDPEIGSTVILSDIITWHDDCSNTTSFVNQQVHLNWYNLLNWANGTWASSGDYLYPEAIDAGSDWHGPTYVAELDQVYPLSYLASFAVAIQAINNDVSYCGKHTVYLADDDFDLILGVHVNDAWSGLQQGGLYGMHRYKDYTGTDNGPVSATSFTGVDDIVSFRVESEIGAFCYNPFYGEKLICEWNETEFSRNIHYIILMSAQSNSNPLLPFRVHDILLTFATDGESIPATTTTADTALENTTRENTTNGFDTSVFSLFILVGSIGVIVVVVIVFLINKRSVTTGDTASGYAW